MHRNVITINLALALLLVGGLGSAAAKQPNFIAPYAGTQVDGDIDTNGDGVPAGVVTGIGKSNLGRFVFQGAAEFLPQLATNVHCPAGTLEFPLLQNINVFFFQATGEQLDFTYTPGGASCFDPKTLTATYHEQGTFSGGTGRFVHATGPFEDNGTSPLLVFDPKGHTFFSFTGTVTGTLTGVKDEEDDRD